MRTNQGMKPERLTLIFAGTQKQAFEWSVRFGVPKQNWRFVRGPNTIRKFRHTRIVRAGTWRKRRDRAAIEDAINEAKRTRKTIELTRVRWSVERGETMEIGDARVRLDWKHGHLTVDILAPESDRVRSRILRKPKKSV